MKVKKLIAELSRLDPEAIVVMASDGEGNGYSPLSGLWTGMYRAETTWSGEVGLERLSAADIKAGYSEEDVIRDGKRAVILTPTN